MKTNNLVSIIIPAYNEENILETTLKAAREQSYPNTEIIVVDNASTDKTFETAQMFADSYRLEEKGVSKARNYGAKKTRGSILVFLDADTIMPPNTIEEISKTIKKGYIGGTCSSRIYQADIKDRIFGRAFSFIRSFLRIPNHIMFCTTEVYEHMNAEHHVFNESLEVCEDVHFAEILKQHGIPRVVRKIRVLTSKRRYAEKGYIPSFIEWKRNYYHRKTNSKYELVR